VAKKQKPVDEVYKRHFYKRKRKEIVGPVVISEKRKMNALDLIRGK